MFIWFAIQAYVIYMHSSGIISACIILGVILWALIPTKASKSKESSNIDYKDPFNMTSESMKEKRDERRFLR